MLFRVDMLYVDTLQQKAHSTQICCHVPEDLIFTITLQKIDSFRYHPSINIKEMTKPMQNVSQDITTLDSIQGPNEYFAL